jgi:hypothetical protein
VIALGSRDDRPDYDDTVSPTFAVFGLADGEARTVRLYDAAGREQAAVDIARDGERVHGAFPGEWTLRWGRGPAVSGTGELELRVP